MTLLLTLLSVLFVLAPAAQAYASTRPSSSSSADPITEKDYKFLQDNFGWGQGEVACLTDAQKKKIDQLINEDAPDDKRVADVEKFMMNAVVFACSPSAASGAKAS